MAAMVDGSGGAAVVVGGHAGEMAGEGDIVLRVCVGGSVGGVLLRVCVGFVEGEGGIVGGG